MRAQDVIIQKYGQPGAAYQAKYCMLWEIQDDFSWFPAKRIFINIDFKDKLFNAFKELETNSLQYEIKEYDGCFVQRNTRGTKVPSLHSWAMAIDLNASIEKLGQLTTHFSPEFIAIILKNGIFWGGNFHKRKDNMHFALFNG